MNTVETIVVGGGPAGAATAGGLAALGRDVMVIERAGGPHHKVCGEFISTETRTYLQRFGIDLPRLGAVPIEEVALYGPSQKTAAALPFQAMSLSRYRLDRALLERAQHLGAQIRSNVSVRSAVPDEAGWLVQCDDGAAVQCRHLVLATGKVGLRGIDDQRDGSMVGLKMHFCPTPELRRALSRRVELFLFDRSYVGLELVEDGIANLCCLLPRDVVAGIGAGWRALHDHLAAAHPDLAARLAGADPHWNKALAVVCPAGGHLHEEGAPAVYRVGDRLAHIPPFTGDGLAIALGSAALAAEHIGAGAPPSAYLAAARRLTGGPVRLASLISGVAASRAGRRVLLGAARLVPGLVEAVARGTRLQAAPQGR
jgi:flavin-dependent dehydrogenase